MSNMPEMLPRCIVDDIVEFINDNDVFKEVDRNRPLGGSVFEIIDKLAIVVYYPIEDPYEENDGLWISGIPSSNGEYKDIIFINTYQTEEKQVFAAAHELGHCLDVIDYVKRRNQVDFDEERIVNRFAAELLMPKLLFLKSITEALNKKEKEDHSISNKDMLRSIVEMMNKFSVPYNSVVIRLVEVGLINIEDGKMLVDGNDNLPLEDIINTVDALISEGDYGTLKTSSRKRKIKNLEEMLREAEEKGVISQAKIDRLKSKFRLVMDKHDALGEFIHITEV